MYCVKRNGIDEGRTYISTITLLGLILKLLDSQPKWKDKYLYVRGDIWDGEQVVPVHSTWNHNFDTTQLQGQKMLPCLSYGVTEKVLISSSRMLAMWLIRTLSLSVVTRLSRYKEKSHFTLKFYIGYSTFNMKHLITNLYFFVGMDFGTIGIDDLVSSLWVDELIEIDSPE